MRPLLGCQEDKWGPTTALLGRRLISTSEVHTMIRSDSIISPSSEQNREMIINLMFLLQQKPWAGFQKHNRRKSPICQPLRVTNSSVSVWKSSSGVLLETFRIISQHGRSLLWHMTLPLQLLTEFWPTGEGRSLLLGIKPFSSMAKYQFTCWLERNGPL